MIGRHRNINITVGMFLKILHVNMLYRVNYPAAAGPEYISLFQIRSINIQYRGRKKKSRS